MTENQLPIASLSASLHASALPAKAEGKKILIIRFSSIGDIVLTTPVIRCIKTQVPGATIHFLTKYSFRAVVEHNPYIDKLFYLQDSWELLLHELKDEGYDVIIDLHHNLRSLRVKRALKGVPAFSFNKLNIEKWLMTALKINRLPAKHIVDRYLDAAALLGVVNDEAGLDYFIPDSQKVQPSDLPHSHLAGYIAIVIGAAHATKQLPLEQLQLLCTLIEHPLILLGGKEDRDLGDAVASVDPVKVYNAAGKFSLHESADLVRNARLVITHDTGLMHIAAAFGKKIISIWGNTIPGFGMTPYYGNKQVEHRIFEVTDLSCRPCSKIGHNRCPRRHFKCMKQISMQEVAEAAMQMLR